MTDKEKLTAIRAEIERRYNERDRIGDNIRANVHKSLISFIDSLQEEPVSIWHDSNKEQPNFASTVAIWNPKYKNGEIISRCTEVYSDRIWAYIDDLLKM